MALKFLLHNGSGKKDDDTIIDDIILVRKNISNKFHGSLEYDSHSPLVGKIN